MDHVHCHGSVHAAQYNAYGNTTNSSSKSISNDRLHLAPLLPSAKGQTKIRYKKVRSFLVRELYIAGDIYKTLHDHLERAHVADAVALTRQNLYLSQNTIIGAFS